MAVRFTRKIDFDALNQRIIDNVQQELEKQVQFESTHLKIRTKSGTDAEGNPFEPYAPETIKRKKAQGKSLSSSWLEDTGHMLMSLQTATERVGNRIVAKIFPMGGTDRKGGTAATKITTNNKTRPFFAWSAEQVTRLKDAISRAIKNATR